MLTPNIALNKGSHIVIYEKFKGKNRYIRFYQFEIFAIKTAEKQRK